MTVYFGASEVAVAVAFDFADGHCAEAPAEDVEYWSL